MSGFRVVEFQLLQECNASCIYCAYEQGMEREPGFLPLELIEKTLAQTQPEWVWFEGGEVTVTQESREYLLKALKIARRLGVHNRINTNAQKLDPDWSVRLVQQGALEFACVSFDSLKPELFCKLRGFNQDKGKELLAELKNNVAGLLKAGVTVDLEATLTKYNVNELLTLYDYAQGLRSPYNKLLMGVQCLVATYDSLFDLYSEPFAMYKALAKLINRAKQGRIPVRICCCPLTFCKYPDLYLPHPHVIWVGCSCGYDYVHVHANGDVFICGFWDHSEPIGNLYEKGLLDIWQSSKLRKDALATVPRECLDCEHWEKGIRCHNTCFSVVHRLTGGFKGQSYPILENAIKKRNQGDKL